MSAPDSFQARALADLALKYNWDKFSLVVDDDEYGKKKMVTFSISLNFT